MKPVVRPVVRRLLLYNLTVSLFLDEQRVFIMYFVIAII